MKFKKITYLIDDSRGQGGRTKLVTGYATDFYAIRLCVRQVSRHWWKVDHYDTGCSFAFCAESTREKAFISACKHGYSSLINGSYQRALAIYESDL
jgi:hypothetical protein